MDTSVNDCSGKWYIAMRPTQFSGGSWGRGRTMDEAVKNYQNAAVSRYRKEYEVIEIDEPEREYPDDWTGPCIDSYGCLHSYSGKHQTVARMEKKKN